MESKRYRWLEQWLGPGLAGFLFLLGIVLGWGIISHPAQAQGLGNLDLKIEKTLVGSEVVQVGQILTFRIMIENTGNISITHIVAEDNFVASIVAPSGFGPFAKPDDPPLSVPAGRFDGINTIVWDDLVESLPGAALAPGETIEIFVHLRAVHPSDQLQIVNEARIKEAISYELRKDMQVRADVPGDVRGSNAPVTKKIANVGEIVVGTLVTFTIEIRNDGLSPIRTLPLSDEFNPSILEFVGAVPPPSLADSTNGLLRWDDLLVTMGKEELAAKERIEIVTTYRAKRATELSVNKAQVSMAQDEYGNTLAPNDSNVPIRIVPMDATATATTVTNETATATATTVTNETATATATTVTNETATATATTVTNETATATATTFSNETAMATATTFSNETATATATTFSNETATATATTFSNETATATATRETGATTTATAPTSDEENNGRRRRRSTEETPVATSITSVARTDTVTATVQAETMTAEATETATWAATVTATIIVPRSLPRTSEPATSPPRTGGLLLILVGLVLIGAVGLRLRRLYS